MIVHELARYAHELTYAELPSEVIEKAKTCILDIMGVSVCSYGHANSVVAVNGARAAGNKGNARVWMTGEKLRAIDAVLANSVVSHCILQDDWHEQSHTHIGATVVPTAISVAEELGSSGKDVLTAVVIGYDIEDRAGCMSVPAFLRGFRPSALYSYFGGAAVTGRLMGLTLPQLENALACAGSACGGVLQTYTDGSMEWSFQEGFGARGGILAATLAAHGLIGSANIFEGVNGINKAYSGTVEGQEVALKDLGQHFLIMETCFKRFAAGGANHGSAAVVWALRRRHKIDHSKVKEIRVDIPYRGTHERMNYAALPYQGPFHTIDQALISKPFAIAAILIEGNLTFDTVKRLQRDPELERLAMAVKLKEADDINGWNLRMEIEMEDGTIHRGDGTDIDHSHLYLSWKMATEKFRQLAEPTLGEQRVSNIIKLVGRLEELDGVEKITRLLAPRKG